MSTIHDSRKPNDGPVEFRTDVTRRLIVHLVRGRAGAVSERELAERLAAADPSPESGNAASDPVRVHRLRMHHVHLPKLADSGLVEWDRDTRTVEATDRPGEDAQRSERAAPIDDRFPADPSGDDGHRREILDIVESGSGPVSRETLARELASSEADGQPTEARIAEVAVDLHHRRLPRLREAGHVEYDVDDGVVKRA